MISKADFVIRYFNRYWYKFFDHPSYVIPKNEGPFASDKPAADRSRTEEMKSALLK